MKDLRFWLAAMMAVVFILGLTACGSSEGSDDPDKPEIPKPETPIADGDWLTIPAAGGTIEKGDITLTFPSGTFSKETKVAVTEVRKGQTVGNDYEASSFYQITMPLKVDKPISVSIKYSDKSNDIRFVTVAPGLMKSSYEIEQQVVCYTGTFSNGSYNLTLPATKNDEDDGESHMTIGLGHAPSDNDASGARIATRADDIEIEGKVGDIEWYYNNSYLLTPSQRFVFRRVKSKFNKYITEAIKHIHSLGFATKTPRKIPIEFFNGFGKDADADGYFSQSIWSDERNSVRFNMYKLSAYEDDELYLKRVTIHELFHYFQSEYDPRSPAKKLILADEENVLCEAGSMWIEHLVNNDTLCANFIEKYMTDYRLSLYDVKEAWKLDQTAKSARLKYSNHGYAMSTLLYYLTHPMSKPKVHYGIDKTKILNLYKKWETYPGKSFYPFELWLQDYGEAWMTFTTYGIDDYWLSLACSQLIPEFNEKILMNNSGNRWIHKVQSDGITEAKESILNTGVDVANFPLNVYKNEKGENSFEGKEIIIKQLSPHARTYITAKSKSGLQKQIGDLLTQGDSMVIAGKDVKNLLGDGNVICLNAININHISTTIDTHVTLEVRNIGGNPSVSPGKLEFPAEGNTQMVVIKKGGYKYCGADIQEADKKWLSKNVLDDGSVYFTATANDTKEKRTTKVTCWVANTANPSDTEKKALPAVEIIQAAGQGNDPQEEESGYELVSGRVSMYYAVAWKWEKSFKPSDDDVTITPNGKGAKVVINQEGVDYTATWKSTISFEIDDLSLNESNKAKIGHFRFELQKTVTPYNYYSNHIDSGSELIRMVAPAPHASASTGYWSYGKDDMSYYQKTTIHYDVWHKDAYSPAQEHTDSNETDVMTDGSWITISLNIQKKK